MVAIWIKFLKSQNKDISLKIYEIIEKIINGDTTGLDIKPLSGKENYFRCRIGNIRIIYTKNINGEIEIKKIGYRGDIYK
ncbi:plasmid stabilization protein [Candidatus Gracilibacteria bacterium]|nr:plasmid stabilization protein [Candidatus Gracilibacteria bacterium]